MNKAPAVRRERNKRDNPAGAWGADFYIVLRLRNRLTNPMDAQSNEAHHSLSMIVQPQKMQFKKNIAFFTSGIKIRV